jgi:hypothetical protein
MRQRRFQEGTVGKRILKSCFQRGESALVFLHPLILLRFNHLARVQYHYWSEFMKKQAWRRVCCCSLYKKTRTLSLLSDAGKLVGCSF